MSMQEKTPIAESLLAAVIADYLKQLAVPPDGKELVTVFGTGEEIHNRDALMVFFGHLPAYGRMIGLSDEHAIGEAP